MNLKIMNLISMLVLCVVLKACGAADKMEASYLGEYAP